MPLDRDRPWWEYPLVIVDFETTGPDPLECAPVSFACIRLEDGQECGAFETLVNPHRPIPPAATEVHGITDAMVAGAPDLADCAASIRELAEGALPCAYNAPFDREVWLRFGITDGGVPLFEPAQKWIDPLVMIRKVDRYVGGGGRHKLEATCTRWGVKLEGAHNALADVRAAGRLLLQLVSTGKLNPRTKLGRLLDYSDEQRLFQDKNRTQYLAKLQDKQQAASQTDLFDAPKEGPQA